MTSLTLNLPHTQRPYGPEDTLLYYDGPLLFWLPVEQRQMLAIALPHDESKCPFLVCDLTHEAAQALLSNQQTVRQVVLNARGWFFMPDYGADVLALEPVTAVPDEWLPGDVMLTL